MKTILAFALLAISLSGLPLGANTRRAAPIGPTPEMAVEARSRAWIKAALDGDVSAFCSFIAEDYVLSWVDPAKGREKTRWATRTRNEWAQLLRSGRVHYQSIELRDTNVRVHGDVAIFSGAYKETVTRDGQTATDEGLFAETWVRRQDEWVIIESTFP
jgi:ketosteroid isomerase-like protein